MRQDNLTMAGMLGQRPSAEAVAQCSNDIAVICRDLNERVIESDDLEDGVYHASPRGALRGNMFGEKLHGDPVGHPDEDAEVALRKWKGPEEIDHGVDAAQPTRDATAVGRHRWVYIGAEPYKLRSGAVSGKGFEHQDDLSNRTRDRAGIDIAAIKLERRHNLNPILGHLQAPRRPHRLAANPPGRCSNVANPNSDNAARTGSMSCAPITVSSVYGVVVE